MRCRRPTLALALAAVIAACDVPLERFHRPDAADDMTPGALGLQAYVKPFNTGAGDCFGQSVALSADGSTLAVGAFREASSGLNPSSNAAKDAGAVYVFVRTGATWTQEAYLKARVPREDDFFGESVALSADGSTLAVGAYSEDSAAIGVDGDDTDQAAPAAGAVHVFTRTGTTWSRQAYVKASNTNSEDLFGKSVALSADGSTLAVGASKEDSKTTSPSDNSASEAGAVYVFTRSAGAWTQQAYVKPSTPIAFDQFGASVALSADGGILAVGASLDVSATATYGKVYVFTRSGTAWTQRFTHTSTTAGSIGALGNSVALSADGGLLAVGASRENSAAPSAGAVYVYSRNGSTWTEHSYVEAPHPGTGDNFGQSIALSADGTTLVVGAWTEDSKATGIDGDDADNSAPDAGAVYLFTRSGTAWTPRAYVKASNAEAGDRFGHSVALSAEAGTLAVGALSEDGAATTIGGDAASNAAGDSGAVYVFR